MKRIVRLFFVIVSAIKINTGLAAAYTWTGAMNTDWYDPLNWSPNGIPIGSDNVIFDGSQSNNLVLVASPTVGGITISGNITIDLGGFTLHTIGDNFFAAGTITNGTLDIQGAVGNTTTFQGTTFDVTVSGQSGSLKFLGSMFNQPVSLIKTGPLTDNGAGGNSFAMGLTIENTGSGGFYFDGPNTFNGTTSITKSGDGEIAITGASIFNGNTTFTLAGGTVFISPNDITIYGGSTFNGTTSFVNNSTNGGTIGEGFTDGNVYNGDIQIENTANGSIFLAHDAYTLGIPNTTVNGNISIVNTGTGYISLGGYNGATSGINLNGDLLVMPGNFTGGFLQVDRINQTAGISDVTLQQAAQLFVQNSTFAGDASFKADNFVSLHGNTFNSNATIEQTDAAENNSWNGNNTFNGSTTITNAGILYLSTTNSDTYNDVTFISNGDLHIADQQQVFFNGDITLGGTQVDFNFRQDVNLTGSDLVNPQIISSIGPAANNFNIDNSGFTGAGLVINNTGAGIVTNTIINIKSGIDNGSPWDDASVMFIDGIVASSPTGFLNFENQTTTSGASDASFVDGPVTKCGTDAFSFPVGDNNFYGPISISAPSALSDCFTAQYFSSTPPNNSDLISGLVQISEFEYWTLSGTGTVSVTLGWNANNYPVYSITSLPDLSVTMWNGTNWTNLGNSGTSGNTTVGTVTSMNTLSSFGLFALGTVIAGNVLPVTWVSFNAKLRGDYVVELQWETAAETNNDHFEVQKSTDGLLFKAVGLVQGMGTTSSTSAYNFIDPEFTKPSYYRLRQVDYDGGSEFSQVRFVDIKKSKERRLIVFPNPVSDYINFWIDGDFFDNEIELSLVELGGNLVKKYIGPLVEVRDAVNSNMDKINAGIYLLEVIAGGRVYSTRVIKN